MVVEFTQEFLKELKKYFSKNQAKEIVVKLSKINVTQGDYIALVKDIVIKEKKLNSHRFYFIHKNNKIQIITKEELKNNILKFISISKKNNQQEIIDKLIKELKDKGFEL